MASGINLLVLLLVLIGGMEITVPFWAGWASSMGKTYLTLDLAQPARFVWYWGKDLISNEYGIRYRNGYLF